MRPAARLLAMCLLAAGAGQAIANCTVLPGNPEVAPDSRYDLSVPVPDEPVVLDLETGLVWQGCEVGLAGSACDVGAPLLLDWSGALQQAAASTYAGFDDWRLPNAQELDGLIETGCAAPMINTTFFPVDSGAALWTSTARAQPVASMFDQAWQVNFSSGERTTVAKSTALRVRLVRAGRGLDSFDAGADYTPDAIVFATRVAQPRSQLVEFGPVSVTGIDTQVGVAVSGAGAPTYSINGGAFGAQPSSVVAGDVLRVRHTTAAGADAAVLSVLKVGPLSVNAESVTANDDATLSSLVLDQAGLAPAFAPSTFAYTASVENAVTNLRVTAQLSDPAASLQIAGQPAASGSPSQLIALVPGANSIVVDVLAEDGVAASQYSINVQRALFPSVTMLSSNAGSVLPGEAVTFTSAVSGDAPTGTVRFLANGAEIMGCAARPLVGGAPATATCSSSQLPAGVVVIRAEYSGDGANLPSSDEISQTVNSPPAISVVSSVSFDEDASLLLPIGLSDAQSPAGQLVLSVTASPSGLFDESVLAAAFSGSDGARTLLVQARADAFGQGLLTLAVEDPEGGQTEATVAVEVLAVNDPPAATMPGRVVHPAGTTGPRVIDGFVTASSVGPANENGQLLAFEVIELSDPQSLVDGLSIDASGRLSYTLSGVGGVARIRVLPIDDGGVERGGMDRGEPTVVRVFVGPGSDVETTLRRVSPTAADLPQAILDGAETGEFSLQVRNHGPEPLAALRLDAQALRGLGDVLWQCEPPAACQPASGAGRARLDTPLGIDETVTVTLSGRFRPEDFHLDLVGAASAAPGVLVGTVDDRRTLVEPLHPSAIFFSGFE